MYKVIPCQGPLLSTPHSLFSIWTDLKRSQGHMEVRREDLANWALWTSPKFTKEVKYQFIRVLIRSEIQKFQSPFAPNIYTVYINKSVDGGCVCAHWLFLCQFEFFYPFHTKLGVVQVVFSFGVCLFCCHLKTADWIFTKLGICNIPSPE